MEKKMKDKISKEFQEVVSQKNPPSTFLKDYVMSFVVGGIICSIGQFVMNTYLNYGVSEENIGFYVAATMVFLGAFLTGLGVYDNIGKHAGAGSIVPITGFANSIVSPAMEFKREGYVFGVAAKMFIIAGPVLVYGIGSSIIVGIIYYFLK